VKESISHSQRAQTQSRAPRKPKRKAKPIKLSELSARLALSPREFGAALGKSATFAYRQIYAGRIRPISDCGRMMIARSEVDRFLSRAAEYNPQSKTKSDADGNGGEA
jgi:hypothetical protein